MNQNNQIQSENYTILSFEKEIVSNYDMQGTVYQQGGVHPVGGNPSNPREDVSSTCMILTIVWVEKARKLKEAIKKHDFNSPCDSACAGTGLTYISWG